MLSSKHFQKQLLAWYDKFGRKNLPWQQNQTPYRVWISEIMLQQTQVNTVIPYFLRFIEQFPDIKTLATANEDLVLHQWAGLGYYSRARNLHKTAQIILQKYHGCFPQTMDELITLPGIGASTAGAILSLAFKQPATILDGNVKRVLARLFAIEKPINEKKTEEILWQHAQQLTPKNCNDHYTQAIMDFGATLCTRSSPNCDCCPLQKKCLAYQYNLVTFLPQKKSKPTLPIKNATMIICQHNQSVLLCKRPNNGIWGGLWSFPQFNQSPSLNALKTFCWKFLGVKINQYESLAAFRHTFTHFHLNIHPVKISINKIHLTSSTQIWYSLQQSTKVGLPKPVQQILKTML